MYVCMCIYIYIERERDMASHHTLYRIYDIRTRRAKHNHVMKYNIVHFITHQHVAFYLRLPLMGRIDVTSQCEC